MRGSSRSTPQRPLSEQIRQRIEAGGDRAWRFEDFKDYPFTAVAQTLSRMVKSGTLERLSRGTYYRARPTAFGKSRPSPAALRELAARRSRLFPAGLAAASHLGFTTQSPARSELATAASSLPRKLVGEKTVVRTRRPAAWAELTETDAALLDFLRQGGKTSELSPEETLRRTLELLAERGRFARLVEVAQTEPPRVRAMLGALGEELGAKKSALARLRSSLNTLSRFDFGVLAVLPRARAWQAKERG